MTEFNLMNGQAIELTKDGILIRGNHIEIDGSVTIVKDDKHASIAEHNDKGFELSVVSIDDEPEASANNSDESPDKHLSPFEKLRKNDEPKIMEPNPIYRERLVQLEGKLSTIITEIDNLKTTIKAERALTDIKITDAIAKSRMGQQI